MRCREAVERIDLGEAEGTVFARLGLMLHLAVCHACRSYFKLSRILSECARKLNAPSTPDFEKLNAKMMRVFAKEN
jgi:hypothetical protein